MDEENSRRRSALGIALGFAVIVVFSLVTDLVLRLALPDSFDAVGHTTDPSVLLFTLVAPMAYEFSGAFLAVQFVRGHRPIAHALVLGALALAASIPASLLTWADVPVWYHLLSLAAILPTTVAGGWTARKRAPVERRITV